MSRSITARLLLLALLTATALGVAQGERGGHLIVAFNGNAEPASLDGQIDPYQSAWLLNSLPSDFIAFTNPVTGAIEPFLATGWEIEDGGRTWTFFLRQDVHFQDGTRFDAEALKYNFERIKAPETASAQAADELGPIVAMEIVDAYTLRLRYDRPWINLLNAMIRIPIWSPTALATYPPGEFDHHLVGTGPFKLVEWVPNSHLTFERWDEYNWGPSIKESAGPVYLERVTFLFISENSVRGRIISTGEVNMVQELPSQFVSDYRNQPGFELLMGFQAGTGLQYVMNVRKPPLDDLRVRQAIRYATNSEMINELAHDGLFQVAYGPLTPSHPCVLESLRNAYPTNPGRARQLLDEAGWVVPSGGGTRVARGVTGVADGTPLNVLWTAISPDRDQPIGEILQAQLAQVGINLTLEIVPGPVQLQRVQERTFDLIYERQRNPTAAVLHQVWHSSNDRPGGWAWTGFHDAALDAILDEIQATADQAASCELAGQAQQIISDNALQLPTLGQPMYYVLAENVKGFTLGKEGNWFWLYNTYID
jgi:peptide/nickel transport system substrate-binding protein